MRNSFSCALLILTGLSACASNPAPVSRDMLISTSPVSVSDLRVSESEGSLAPEVFVPAGQIEPVSLAALRGQKVAVFPDVSVEEAVEAVEAFSIRCLDSSLTRSVTQSGYTYFAQDSVPQLTLTFSSVRNSSAVGLKGALASSALERAIGESVMRGDINCPIAEA